MSELYIEIWACVFDFLPLKHRVNCRNVCKLWCQELDRQAHYSDKEIRQILTHSITNKVYGSVSWFMRCSLELGWIDTIPPWLEHTKIMDLNLSIPKIKGGTLYFTVLLQYILACPDIELIKWMIHITGISFFIRQSQNYHFESTYTIEKHVSQFVYHVKSIDVFKWFVNHNSPQLQITPEMNIQIFHLLCALCQNTNSNILTDDVIEWFLNNVQIPTHNKVLLYEYSLSYRKFHIFELVHKIYGFLLNPDYLFVRFYTTCYFGDENFDILQYILTYYKQNNYCHERGVFEYFCQAWRYKNVKMCKLLVNLGFKFKYSDFDSEFLKEYDNCVEITRLLDFS